MQRIDKHEWLKTLSFRTSRSSGKGGQNVNKVETRVEVSWDLENDPQLWPETKAILRQKLENKLSKEGIITVDCEETRSQLKNKEIAVKKLFTLILDALKPEKERKATRPTKASVTKRLEHKKWKSAIKESRRTFR